MAVKSVRVLPLLTTTALRSYLSPKLAQDANLDLSKIVGTPTRKTWTADKANIKAALDRAIVGKLAKDADVEDVMEVLDQLDDVKDEIADTIAAAPAEGDDPEAATDDDAEMMNRMMEFLKGKLSDEDMEHLKTMMKPEVDPAKDEDMTDEEKAAKAKKDKEMTKDGDKPVTKSAMDAAISTASASAARAAEASTVARFRAIAEAEKDVRPYIGEVAMAQDSADDVYKLALDAMRVDLTGVPPAAYRALLKALPRPNATGTAPPRQALDSKTNADFEKLFPGASSLKRR